MHQNLVAILAYPRYLIRSDIDLVGCPHSGIYDKFDHECTECVNTDDCIWLNNVEDTSMLEKYSDMQLLHTLEHAIVTVVAQMSRWEHDTTQCDCESCTWLRKAQTLFDQTH